MANEAGKGSKQRPQQVSNDEYAKRWDMIFARDITMERKNPVKLFIDTEFNGFGGQILSIALVPLDKSYPSFYKEFNIAETLNPWVLENVIPNMNLVPKNKLEVQLDLENYINDLGDCIIIADWPDDIKYFNDLLITGPGMMLNIHSKLLFEVDRTLEYTSKVPHHALHDAEGIRNTYLNKRA